MLSADKSIKYLFATADGRSFETVYIPESKRTTVCVSTQSGCRMGCSFCVTADYGFRGNLSAGEIVNQIISLPEARKVTHVVFMGMGEPMDNLDNVIKACEILTAEWGLAVSQRNITVSTVGITPGISRFLEESSCNLALSLHSPFAEERCSIVPAERKNPSIQILDIMKSFPVKKGRRLSVAYVMINDFNDRDIHLEALKTLLKGTVIRVNLLPYHQSGNDNFIQSPYERMLYFKHNLVIAGISASIRKSRGADISAACGLLAKDLQ
jgi:23S rRNA (adenine2503-C2)-methyltransferase